MRRYYGILFIVLLAACSDSPKFIVDGKITNAEGQYLYLDELKVSTTVNVDSVKLTEEGTFRFSGAVGYPTFYLLRLKGKNNFITLLVDSAEHISITSDASDFTYNYAVTGSEGSLLVQELNRHLWVTKLRLDSIRALQLTLAANPDFARRNKALDDEYHRIRQTQIDFSKDFVMKHPFSMASVLALYQKFDEKNYVIQDLHSLKVAATALHNFFPQSEHTQALYNNTLQLMREAEAARQSAVLKQLVDEYGENSIDITLPDRDGNDVPLSAFRGKYVLLHFWAAADEGSRIVNPVLAELYQKYHDKGFDIYQVSTDTDRYLWHKAIEDDHLTWTNVGDMKGSIKATLPYNVKQIPWNYLLDKDGIVIGVNLKGPQLEQKIQQVLK
ncbi:MAG: AhpC/TSA family protein [Bacteroidales bacterium]|nr:AhpC/TSA family protein [Bacteroidales bacterium]